MSNMKTIMLLDVPEILIPKPDGSVATENIVKEPFTCPRCHGAGTVFADDPDNGQLTKVQCDICLGFGELKANIAISWGPSIRKLKKSMGNGQD